MPLKKPPIVEMWVEFNFDPNPAIEVESAVSFLQEYAQQYPKWEVSQEDRLEFRHISPKKLPELVGRKIAIKHLRAHDEQGSRWLHVTPRQLVCNFIRLGENYPGFSVVAADAVVKLGRYVELCRPLKLRFAAIHYVDVIDVPVSASGKVHLGEYFALGLNLPSEPFGDQVSYLIQTTVVPPDGSGSLEIQLQLDSVVRVREALRFRMDWHKVCQYDAEVDLERISEGLRLAHESVMRCFPAAFTERTWALFEPTD